MRWFVVGMLAAPVFGAGLNYTDGFEAATFNSFWTVTQTLGTVTPSNTYAHTGAQAAVFSSTSGGQRSLNLIHTEPTAGYARYSVWLYDTVPGQQTLYALLSISDTSSSFGAFIGIQDFDASCYAVGVFDSSGNYGPGAACGSAQQYSTSAVQRTIGWHQLTIDAGPASIILSIDGVAQFTRAGSFVSNSVALTVFGPGFRPDATFAFDDFSAVSVPEPGSSLCLLGVLLLAWRRCSLCPHKLN